MSIDVWLEKPYWLPYITYWKADNNQAMKYFGFKHAWEISLIFLVVEIII